MNIIDSIIHLYGHSLKGSYLLTPLRIIVRSIADKAIPQSLLKERLPEDKRTSYRDLIEDRKIVVSLTSFPARIDKVHLVIRCLKRQTVRPDKIVLWLSKEQFNGFMLPDNLTSLVDDVFEIRMEDKDYRSHKKYCYSFKEFNNDLVILVDDDIYYQSTMIEELLKGLYKHPNAVICQYGSMMRFNEDGTLPPFNAWWKEKRESRFSKDFFFGTGGGSLFQPNRIVDTILDIELAMRLAPSADDIWVNAMVRLSGLSIYKIECGLLLQMTEQQASALKQQNSYSGQNDEQFKNVITYFINYKGINPFAKRDN